MHYSTAQANRIGNRASNQDRCLIAQHAGAVLLAVADGMGGHARGDLAAQACVDTLARQFRARQGLEDPGQFLREALRAAHRTIQRVGQTQVPPIMPLTTVVACLVQDQVAYWAHVGDSRAYLLRDGRVELRTRDHTRVAEMVEAGLITEQQARLHPLRNQVSLCLGGSPATPSLSLGPGIPLQAGDTLLLCSDGLWSAVSERTLIESLAQPELPRGLKSLTEAAERASYPQSDNVSAVALRYAGQQPVAPPGRERKDGAGADPLQRAIADIQQALADYETELPPK